MGSKTCLSKQNCVRLVWVGVNIFELIRRRQQTSVTSLFFVHFLTTDESCRGGRKAEEVHAN